MQDDFDDSGMGLPDDEMGGGADLGELEPHAEAVEAGIAPKPAGRAGGVLIGASRVLTGGLPTLGDCKWMVRGGAAARG